MGGMGWIFGSFVGCNSSIVASSSTTMPTSPKITKPMPIKSMMQRNLINRLYVFLFMRASYVVNPIDLKNVVIAFILSLSAVLQAVFVKFAQPVVLAIGVTL